MLQDLSIHACVHLLSGGWDALPRPLVDLCVSSNFVCMGGCRETIRNTFFYGQNQTLCLLFSRLFWPFWLCVMINSIMVPVDPFLEMLQNKTEGSWVCDREGEGWRWRDGETVLSEVHALMSSFDAQEGRKETRKKPLFSFNVQKSFTPYKRFHYAATILLF